jgi:hypothetical protein
MEKTTIMALSLPTKQLIDMMKTGKQGDILTTQELKKACGRNVNSGGDGYNNLASAIRHCINNYSLVWKWVRGLDGIRCLGPIEIVSVSESDRKSIAKRAKRSCRKLATIDDGKLADGEKVTVNTQRAFMGSLAMFASPSTSKAFEGNKILHVLPPKSILEVFGKKD